MIVSVIVPVYNVQDYLHRCLDSIVNQSYKDLEIVCINDGSTDYSLNILNEYASKDDRIKIINQKNKGLSATRNEGISNSSGDFIFFIDSDDFLEKDCIKELVKNQKTFDSDISICLIKFHMDDKIIKEEKYKFKELTGRKAVDMYYRKRTNMQPMVWNKLYSRKLFSNISFEEGLIHEDKYFTPRILRIASNISFCNYAGYNYIVDRPGSITNKKYTSKNLAGVVAEYSNYLYFKESLDFELANKALERYYSELPYYYCLFKTSHDELAKIVYNKSKSDIVMMLSIRKTKGMYKTIIKNVSFICFPRLYYVLWRLKNE